MWFKEFFKITFKKKLPEVGHFGLRHVFVAETSICEFHNWTAKCNAVWCGTGFGDGQLWVKIRLLPFEVCEHKWVVYLPSLIVPYCICEKECSINTKLSAKVNR